MQEPENVSFDGDISQLGVTAIQFHEMFLELKRAGFKHVDAVQIIGIVMSSSMSYGSFGYDEDDFDSEELDLDEEESDLDDDTL